MVKTELISLLENNRIPRIEDLDQLKILSLEYPYFQAVQALYLKALKYYHKIDYNEQIRKTASISIDRTVLFEYITQDLVQLQNTEPTTIDLEGIPEEVDKSENTEAQDHADKAKIKDKKTIIEVLDFKQNDTYSFNEWLKLSSEPKRSKAVVKDEKGQIIPAKKKFELAEDKSEKKENQRDLIDSFLSSNPKMPRPNPLSSNEPVLNEKVAEEELMTETLAKVYLAQKKFDKAIFAYRILSLKNPEKSGLFADQIRKIEQIKKNK